MKKDYYYLPELGVKIFSSALVSGQKYKTSFHAALITGRVLLSCKLSDILTDGNYVNIQRAGKWTYLWVKKQ